MRVGLKAALACPEGTRRPPRPEVFPDILIVPLLAFDHRGAPRSPAACGAGAAAGSAACSAIKSGRGRRPGAWTPPARSGTWAAKQVSDIRNAPIASADDGGFKIPWSGRPPFGVEGGIAAHSTNRMSLDAEPSCDAR